MNNKIWFGFIMIVLGTFFWLGKFGIINFYWNRDWPIILIVIGLVSLVNIFTGRKRKISRNNRAEILKKLENEEIDVTEAIKLLKNG